MVDLYFGLAILVLVAVAAFWMARRLTRNGPGYRCELLAIQVMLLMGWYTLHLWHQFSMARLLPFANLVIIGNWFLPFSGFMAGLAWHRVHGHPLRRLFVVLALPGAAFYSAIYPILGDKPACADHWHDGICLQTTSHTCSPASAATLLLNHGIPATEQEMVDLCLTRGGTTWAGLYRGLKYKTAGTPWDVEFFECSIEDLRLQWERDRRPMILSVGIERGEVIRPEYVTEWGLIPGLPHSVVLFRMVPNNVVVVGDPAQGREVWAWRDMLNLWHGQGIRLVPRDRDAAAVAAVTAARR